MTLNKMYDFKYTESDYSLKGFIETFAHQLPVVIRISEGVMGRLDYMGYEYEFGGGDSYRVHGIKRQPRVLVEEEGPNGRQFSIPIDYPVKFNLRRKGSRTFSDPMSIKDIVENYMDQSDETLIIFIAEQETDFKLMYWGGLECDTQEYMKPVGMRLIMRFDEKYLMLHTLDLQAGKLYPVTSKLAENLERTGRAMPDSEKGSHSMHTHISVKVEVAIGLKKGSRQDFQAVMHNFYMQTRSWARERAPVDEDIYLFHGFDSSGHYDYIAPPVQINVDHTKPPVNMDAIQMETSSVYGMFDAFKESKPLPKPPSDDTDEDDTEDDDYEYVAPVSAKNVPSPKPISQPCKSSNLPALQFPHTLQEGPPLLARQPTVKSSVKKDPNKSTPPYKAPPPPPQPTPIHKSPLPPVPEPESLDKKMGAIEKKKKASASSTSTSPDSIPIHPTELQRHISRLKPSSEEPRQVAVVQGVSKSAAPAHDMSKASIALQGGTKSSSLLQDVSKPTSLAPGVPKSTSGTQDVGKGVAPQLRKTPPPTASKPKNLKLRLSMLRNSSVLPEDQALPAATDSTAHNVTEAHTLSMNSTETHTLSVNQLADWLHKIKLDKYAEEFRNETIDGQLLVSIVKENMLEDVMQEFNMSKMESQKLKMFAKGWRPNTD